MNGKLKAAVVLAATLTGAGCDMLTEPQTGWQVIGIIAWEPDGGSPASLVLDLSSALAAPDTVTAGVAFNVTVTTIGANPCWRQDGAAFGASQGAFVLTPLDLVPSSDGRGPQQCEGDPVLLPRTLRLVISQPGAATLRLHGRRVVGGDVASAAPASLERPIIVR